MASKHAEQFIEEAKLILRRRGDGYDENRERSIPHIVQIFNAITGHKLTVDEGWTFMQCVKLARMQRDPKQREDHFLDLIGYTALRAEERLATQKNLGPVPSQFLDVPGTQP